MRLRESSRVRRNRERAVIECRTENVSDSAGGRCYPLTRRRSRRKKIRETFRDESLPRSRDAIIRSPSRARFFFNWPALINTRAHRAASREEGEVFVVSLRRKIPSSGRMVLHLVITPPCVPGNNLASLSLSFEPLGLPFVRRDPRRHFRDRWLVFMQIIMSPFMRIRRIAETLGVTLSLFPLISPFPPYTLSCPSAPCYFRYYYFWPANNNRPSHRIVSSTRFATRSNIASPERIHTCAIP